MIKGLFRGCLIGIGILVVLSVLGSLFGGKKSATPVAVAALPTQAARVVAPTDVLSTPVPTEMPQPTDTPPIVAPTEAAAVTAAPVVMQDAAAPAPGSESYPCKTGQVKANRNTKIYHVPGGLSYARTQANVQCFDTSAAAEAAGFRAAKR